MNVRKVHERDEEERKNNQALSDESFERAQTENSNNRLHRRRPITNPEEVMAGREKERELGGGEGRKKKREKDTQSPIIKIKLMLPSRESSDFSLFHPNRSRPSPRRAFFLFRSIFRRAASVAHPSTNRRGGALSRRRVDGNGKASGVIFDFSPRRKSASRRWCAQFF